MSILLKTKNGSSGARKKCVFFLFTKKLRKSKRKEGQLAYLNVNLLLINSQKIVSIESNRDVRFDFCFMIRFTFSFPDWKIF